MQHVMPGSQGVGEPQFGRALRAAMRHRGMTLDELGQALAGRGTPMSSAMLSYWTNGRALPPTHRALETVRCVEQVLSLPAGQLVGRLPSDALSRWDSVLRAPFTQHAQAALEAMGLWPLDQFRIVVVYDSVDVDETWHDQVDTTRQLIRAQRDGLDRFAVVLETDEGEVPLVTAGLGCRLGRVVMLPPDRLFIAELELSRPLVAGELFWCAYTLTWNGPLDGAVGLARVLPRRADLLVLDSLGPGPGLEPSYSVTPYGTDLEAGPSTVTQELATDRYLQVAVEDAAEGTHVLQWSMP